MITSQQQTQARELTATFATVGLIPADDPARDAGRVAAQAAFVDLMASLTPDERDVMAYVLCLAAGEMAGAILRTTWQDQDEASAFLRAFHATAAQESWPAGPSVGPP